jgi:tellurite methyltransferase
VSQADQDKWNLRYREGAYASRTHPSAFMQEWLPQLRIESAQPRALDVASGAGRNAIYLAQLGWHVDALDISQVALDRIAATPPAIGDEKRLPITCTQADLENSSQLPSALRLSERYDLAVVIRYTNLPLIEQIESALKGGGYLIVELHLQTDADVVGPRNPRFRVAAGALRAAAQRLVIEEYREGRVEEIDGRLAALAQLIARKRQHR